MSRAICLAKNGVGATDPNPLVGAVIVKGNKIIGEGWHRQYGSAHAEVEALNSAGKEAKGSIIYVTLEPCNHQGKTPPCTEAIISAGISKVFVAMRDPNMAVKGGGIERLRDANVEVEVGLLEKEAQQINTEWIKRMREKEDS